MSQIFNFPAKLDSSRGALPIELGGLGSVDPKQGALNIGLVTQDQVRKPNGVFLLDANGRINKSDFPPELADPSIPSLFGPVEIEASKTHRYKITNYDAFTSYFVTSTAGSVTRDGEDIFLTAGDVAGETQLVVNGKQFFLTIIPAVPDRPSILTPIEDEEFTNSMIEATASPFLSANPSDTHLTSDWEVATDPDFLQVVRQEHDSGTFKTHWNIFGLTESARYFLRVRYRSSQGGVSEWSEVLTFRAEMVVPDAPIILTPTAGSLINDLSYEATSSPFESLATNDVHHSSDWQLSTSSDFSTILQSSMMSKTDLTSWTLKALSPNVNYYLRVRYRGESGTVSAWSETRIFQATKTNGVTMFATQRDTTMMHATDHTVMTSRSTSKTTSYWTSWTTETSRWTDNGEVSDNRDNRLTFFSTATGKNTSKTTSYTTSWATIPNVTTTETTSWNTDVQTTVNKTTSRTTNWTTQSWSVEPVYVGDGPPNHYSTVYFDVNVSRQTSYSTTSTINTQRQTSQETSWETAQAQETIYQGSTSWNTYRATQAATPNTPTCSAVYNGAGSQIITATSSPFSSPDVSDAHLSSDWEMTPPWGNKVYFNGRTGAERTQCQLTGVSEHVTGPTTWKVRVRHRSSNGVVSAWSAYAEVIVPGYVGV